MAEAADDSGIREGEVALAFDPGARPDAGVTFIGRIRSPWSRGDCPRNIRRARETGQGARVELDPAYAPGLAGLEPGRAVFLIYWMDRARRDLIVQAPHHTDGLRGVFAIRSPVRPNPVAMSVVRITDIDLASGSFGIDATDVFDNTPLIDIKPFTPTVDTPPDD